MKHLNPTSYCLIIAIICVGISAILADPQPENPQPASIWPAHCVRVVDGDTIDVTVTKTYRIRLVDCWAPEVKGDERPEGLKSKAAMEAMAMDREGIVVIPWKPHAKDELTFGRHVGQFFVDGVDVGDALVKAGFATKEKQD